MMLRSVMMGALCGALLLSACKKEPGEGGKAEIRGHVFVKDYNNGVATGLDYYAQEYRVYIVYGSHDAYDNDTRTGPDGLFEFNWLRKGKYTVYTYSECPTCPGNQEAVSASVEITGKKDVVDVPDLVVENWH